MFIELGLDTTKFSKGTTQARNAVKFFGSEVRALDNVMKSSGKGVDTLGAKHKALARQITAQKNLISQLYKEYNIPN
ncbi:phage tail tape measure protein, partial [Streptococcus danieliae]|nr:phage tail tape measure protein [Streptococcus danieliae]